MLEDPTFSLALRIEYSALLKGISQQWREEYLNRIVGNRDYHTYAKDTSYDPKHLIRSLDTNVGKRSIFQIAQAIKYQIQHGFRLAQRQIKFKKTPTFLGKFINIGTIKELTNVSVGLVRSINKRFHDKLSALVAKVVGSGKLSWNKFVQQVKKLGAISGIQAEQIARTEVIRTVTAGQQEEYLRQEIKKWVWITQIDERVCGTCRPLHNKIVEIGKSFGNFRGTPITKPPAHPNCRCGVEPYVQE